MNTKQFVHLHVHSHYSIMNGCNTVPQLVDRAIKDRMKGMALTEHREYVWHYGVL